MEKDKTTMPLIDRINLDERFGTYSPASTETHVPNIPFKGVPSPSFQPSGGKTSNAKSDLDYLRDLSSYPTVDTSGGSKMRSLAESSSNRYPFYNPDADNEDAYGQGQGWGSKMVNGVGKGIALTGTTFLQSTVGFVNGLGEWMSTGRLASFYDNDFNRSLDEFNKELEDKLPNFYTQAERDARWYSPSKLFSANFVWDGVVKNLGFAAGAALSGAAYLKALSSIPYVSRLFSIGKQAEAIAKIEAGMTSANRGVGVYGQLKSLSDKFLGSYNLMNPAGRAVIAGLATTGEAGFEAYHNLNDFRNEKIEEFERLNGRRPTGEELEHINQMADMVGNTTLTLNLGLLTFTNYIQFPKILGSSYKAEKGMINSLVKNIDDIVEEGGKYVVKPSRLGKIGSIANTARRYTFSASEAFEEGAQFAVGKASEDYFNKKYMYEDAEILDSIYAGIRETITTDEGMENVVIGGLSGSIMQARGRFMEDRRTARNTQEALKDLNKARLSAFTRDTFESVKRGVALQEEREKALVDGNVLQSKDLEADYVINYLTPRIKHGRYDLVRDEIQSYREIASTDEGFNQLQSQGVVLEGDTREAFLNRLSHLESVANNVKSLYQSLNLRYGNLVGEDGKRLYSDKVMDRMVYAASKIADYDDRILKLTNEIAAAGVDPFIALDEAVKGDEKKFDEMVNNFLARDILEEKKAELLQNSEDALILHKKRQSFLKEYEAIKANPKQFEPKTERPDTQQTPATPGKAPEKIKIKTARGEKEYEVGKQYRLGRVVKYDAKGNEVISFPRFTLMGRNEDGTIRIKDKSGPRDISEEEFENYNVFTDDSVKNRPNAAFYDRNVNNVVKMKKKGGGTYNGRLVYDAKNDRLYFVYKNNKGKIVEKPIETSMFKPTGKYKEGLLSFGTKLTPADEKDITDSGKDNEEKRLERRSNRIGIINSIFTELAEQQERIQKLIEGKKKQVSEISDRISNLEKEISEKNIDKRSSKSIRFRKVGREALRDIIELSRTRSQLEQEITDLQGQEADLESELAFISDFEMNLDEMPDRLPDFLEELKDQVSTLENTILDIGEQISSLESIKESVEKTILSAIDFLADLIDDFARRFPNAVISTFQGRMSEYVRSGKKFFEENPGYEQALREFEDGFSEIEDSDVKANEKLLKDIQDDVAALYKKLDEVQKELTPKMRMVERFEEAREKYLRDKAEQEKLAKNQELISEAIGTKDKGQRTGVFDPSDPYEPDPKKSTELVVRSTTFPTKSTKPHHERADRFAFRFSSMENKGEIKGVYVTLNNEESVAPGLMDHLRTDEAGNIDGTVDPKTTIAMLVMRQDDDGSVYPVDEFGNRIEQKDILSKGVYQVFPLEKLTWNNGDSMFRSSVTPEVQQSMREQYTAWRKKVLSSSSVEVHSIDVSFGFPQYNRDADGNIDFNQRTPVMDAGLITEDDLTTRPVLTIGTTDAPVAKGTTSYEKPKGRIFLETGNAYVPVNNRRFTEEEADVMFQVIRQLAVTMMKGGINTAESKRLLRYLRSVVYWGTPETIDGERKADGYNSVYFETGPEGDLVLKISGKDASFKFTPTSLDLNRSEITLLLSRLHNDVKNHMVKNIGEEYEQIVGINPDGSIKSITWPNYQTYLLSPNNPEGGKRTNPVPLFTPIKPVTEAEPINRRGFYFYTTDTVDDYQVPVPKAKPAAVAPNPTEKKSQARVSANFDSREPSVYTSPTGRKLYFFIATGATESNEDSFQLRDPEGLKNDRKEIMEELKAKGLNPRVEITRAIFKILRHVHPDKMGPETPIPGDTTPPPAAPPAETPKAPTNNFQEFNTQIENFPKFVLPDPGFIPDKTLVDSSDPRGFRKRQSDIMAKFEKLKKLIDCVG